MQSLKIILTLLVLVGLGIVVGSNILPTMAITILNQPTVTLPIGVWLAIAIGSGLLSSSIIQLLLSLESRRSNRKIRQLQSRLQQDDDIFTYPASAPENEQVSPDPPDLPEPKKSLFNSYRFPVRASAPKNLTNNSTSKSPTKPSVVDDSDDWEPESVVSRQLDWDDVRSPRQQPTASDKFSSFRPKNFGGATSAPEERDYELNRRSEVYDADFRLIQPPYKEPDVDEFDDREEVELDFEYPDQAEDEEVSFSTSSVASRSTNRDTRSNHRAEDDEDWGFDFEEEDLPKKR